jgi:hypothetical protein
MAAKFNSIASYRVKNARVSKKIKFTWFEKIVLHALFLILGAAQRSQRHAFGCGVQKIFSNSASR